MLVTKQAPDFTATTVLADGQIVEDFKLSENYGEKGTVLFIVNFHTLLGERLQ